MEVEDQIQLANIAKVTVQALHKMMNLRDFKRPVRISTPPKSNKRPLKKAAISKKKRSSVPTQQLIFQATSSFSPGGSLFLLNIQMRMTHR